MSTELRAHTFQVLLLLISHILSCKCDYASYSDGFDKYELYIDDESLIDEYNYFDADQLSIISFWEDNTIWDDINYLHSYDNNGLLVSKKCLFKYNEKS